MTHTFLFISTVWSMLTLVSCSDGTQTTTCNSEAVAMQHEVSVQNQPHEYGGWYCPDNLNGFPAVDIGQWKNVPVVNGRMPTQVETRSGASLIFVDPKKYPNAHPLDITLPKLATVYNQNTRRQDIIIVIQAVKINDDSIVGYRFLNGGNGSARLNEIEFLSEKDIQNIPDSRFVTHNVDINTIPEKIWDVLTRKEYAKTLQPTFEKSQTLKPEWRRLTNVNYTYAKAGSSTSKYADVLFGNYYIQNDFDNNLYSEKFFLSQNKETNTTELKIVCGPFGDDFKTQKQGIIEWSKSVKDLSEH